jgi:hypothetical protein
MRASGTDHSSGRMRKPARTSSGPPARTASCAQGGACRLVLVRLGAERQRRTERVCHLAAARMPRAARAGPSHLRAKWAARDLEEDERDERQHGQRLPPANAATAAATPQCQSARDAAPVRTLCMPDKPRKLAGLLQSGHACTHAACQQAPWCTAIPTMRQHSTHLSRSRPDVCEGARNGCSRSEPASGESRGWCFILAATSAAVSCVDRLTTCDSRLQQHGRSSSSSSSSGGALLQPCTLRPWKRMLAALHGAGGNGATA